MSGFNPVANASRVRALEGKREKELEELERKRKEAEARSDAAGLMAFGTSERAAVDAAHSAATVGLVSRADFLAARDRAEAQAEAEAEAKKAAGVAASEKARDAQRAARDAQRKRERAALSFAADDDSDEDDSDDDDGRPPPKRAAGRAGVGSDLGRGLGKDPTVQTDFLPDRAREDRAARAREELAAQWHAREDELKQEPLRITYSFWDGRGHRREVQVPRGSTVSGFLDAVRRQLSGEGFREMKRCSTDDLLYIKEDLILPSHVSFHELIAKKARGKSGPLFHFDVHDDIRLKGDATKEKDESHAGKVCERHWYERNKGSHPASRWELWDPDKDYGSYAIFGP